jgi:uncharacterized protein YndB with AHSA1/START domain
MMRWILGIGVALFLIFGLAFLVGLALPKGHRASRTMTLAADPARVFAIVSDFKRYPEWRPDVKKIEVDGNGGPGTIVREESTMGTIPFKVETLVPPSRMMMRIADPNLGFGGTWTYDLQSHGTGTSLTITEDGEVYNPLFRVMQKFFFSPYKTIDTYLANLQKKLAN